MKLYHHPLFNEAADSGNGGNGGGSGSGQGATTAGTTTLLSQSAQQSAPVSPGSNSNSNGNEGVPYDFRTAFDDKGGFKQGWTDALPDDLKEYAPTLGKYPNPVEALRGLGNAQKLIGQRQTIKPPGSDAKPEEITAWRKMLGVPENAEGYGIKAPEKLPEGVKWDDKTANDFAKLAHEINLTPAQAQKLLEFDIGQKQGLYTKGMESLTTHQNQQRTMLQEAWGDKYQDNMNKAIATAERLGLDPNDAELGNSAKFIKALHQASHLFKEDVLLKGAAGGATGEQAAEDIRRNPNNPLHKAYIGAEGKERQQFAAAEMMRLRGVKVA